MPNSTVGGTGVRYKPLSPQEEALFINLFTSFLTYLLIYLLLRYLQIVGRHAGGGVFEECVSLFPACLDVALLSFVVEQLFH